MAEQQSHYTVLARRFRPQTFEEVVGQEHVAQALRNAIRSGRVAHAYLFTGARGVGKTSMARILAKSLNCPDARDAVPCHVCEICRGIASGSDVDVLEIDGASNRGIDDVRTLRANVTVKSMRTKYKMYIIDEVHMLTKEAFNALLKTLEEPPPNVKFVFCTTEPNKVPDTILSRCQRFDFGTIATSSIAQRLAQIAQAEHVEVEPEALELVARRAAGSMRDSQSLFDQLLAFGGDRITAADVHQLFGTASDSRLIELVDALRMGQCDSVLRQLDKALAEGVQLGELTSQLVYCLRDVMVLASGGKGLDLLGMSNARRDDLARLAQQWGLRSILAAMQILATAQSRMQRTTCGRALLELALVQVALLGDLEELAELLAESRSSESASNPSPRTAPQAGSARPTSRPAGRSVSAASPSVAPPLQLPTAPEEKSDLVQKKSDVVRQQCLAESRPSANTEETRRGEASVPVGGPGQEHDDARPESPGLAENTSAVVQFVSGQEPVLWTQLIAAIEHRLKSHLDCVSLIAISGPNKLELSFPRSYHFSKQYCERPEVRKRIEAVVSGIVGRSIQVAMVVEEDEGPSPVAAALAEASTRRRDPEQVSDPYVRKALSLFKAKVAKSEPLPTSHSGEGSLD